MAEGLAQLTEATFAEEIGSSEVPVLVDFWATWCKPCLMVAPILEEIADEQADQLKIVKVDVDSESDARSSVRCHEHSHDDPVQGRSA